jgi:hypothetical protein
MAGQLQEVTQSNFSGGMNLRASPFALKKNELRRVINLVGSERGALVTRPGYEVISSYATTTPILSLGTLNLADRSSKSYAVLGGATNQLYNTTSGTWAAVGNFSTYYNIPQTAMMNNALVFAAGYEVPKYWNGTTLGAIATTDPTKWTVPVGAKHIAYHLGSLWVWNTAAVSTATAGPSSLQMSNVDTYNDWTAANQIHVGIDDGQVGMGLASFTIVETGISPTAALILFKNYSAYQVTGTFFSTNWSIQRLKSDMGCIAPRTIQFISGFGVVRLTHKGFALYDGVEDKLLSVDIQPAIFGTDPLVASDHAWVPINFAAAENSWAVQSADPPLYIAGLPVAGTTLNRIFVFDLINKCWTIWDYPVDFTCMQSIYYPTNTRVYAGATSGSSAYILNLMNHDNTTDSGTAIAWEVETGPIFIGSPTNNSYWKRFIVDADWVVGQDFTMTGEILGQTGALVKTKTITSTSDDDQMEMGINKIGPYVTGKLSGTGLVKLRSLGWHARSKPLGRVQRIR